MHILTDFCDCCVTTFFAFIKCQTKKKCSNKKYVEGRGNIFLLKNKKKIRKVSLVLATEVVKKV